MRAGDHNESDSQSKPPYRLRKIGIKKLSINKQIWSCAHADGMITFVNQAYCDFLKKPADLLIGRSMFEFIPPYEQPGVRNNIALITKESPVVQARNQLIDADGQWHYVNWVDRGIFEEDELLEIQGVGRNITNEIKKKSLKIPCNNAIKNLVEEMPGVVYVMHAATMLPIYLSPQIERLVGYTPQHIYQNTQSGKRDLRRGYFRRSERVTQRAAGEEIPQHEFRFRHKDGHLVGYRNTDRSFNPRMALINPGVFLDITEAQSIRQTKNFMPIRTAYQSNLAGIIECQTISMG